MTKDVINNYSGVIYEMGVEISEGKEFTEVRRETAYWLKEYDEKASRQIAFCNATEFASAFTKIQDQQQAFDVAATA
jgi:hypothetical protein